MYSCCTISTSPAYAKTPPLQPRQRLSASSTSYLHKGTTGSEEWQAPVDTAEPPGGRLPSAEPHTDPLHILFHVDTARRSNHVKAYHRAVIVLLVLLVDTEATAPAG